MVAGEEDIDADEYEDLDIASANLPFVANVAENCINNHKLVNVNENFAGRKPNIWFIEDQLKKLTNLQIENERLIEDRDKMKQ